MLLSSCCIIRVKALNSNEWSCTYAFDKTTYYQGDSGTVTITFTSNCPDQLIFSSLSVQFDWMTTPTTETVSSPNIATGNSYTFPAIGFSIPSDAVVGSHSFTLSMQGQQKELLGWTNISPTATASNALTVDNAYELVYNNDIQGVQTSLTNAQNSNYQSPDAQASLQQAENMYNQATTLAQQGQWQNAVTDLNTASDDLSQAQAQEASYTTPTPTNNNTPTPTPAPIISISNNTIIYVVVIVVIIIAVIGVVVGIVVKQRASKKAKPT
jgi:hypothetical protein